MRRAGALVGILVFAVVAAACKEEGSITVHDISFKGVQSVDESRLRSALATRMPTTVPLVHWRVPWAKQSYFDRSRFEADLKRVEAFYADRGFPDARVTAFDVKLNDKQDAVDVSLTISEGEPVRVAAIDFVGFDGVPPDHLATMKRQVPLRIGEPRDRQLVVTTHELALNELRDHGFPYAKVATAEDTGSSGKEATLTFTAEPGRLAHFGPMQINGNSSVSDHVIARQVTFKPGELYQRSLVQDTQRRLYGMELFQFVNVEPLNTETQPEEVPTRITVAEGKHQRVNLGVGYGTEEKARVEAEYHHVNFLGGARSAGVHGRWSSLDRGIRVDFNQPYFFAPHFSFGAEGQDWYTYTPAYSSSVLGAKASVTHRTSERSSWSVSLTSERDVSTISDAALHDPTARPYLIALGLDPTTGEQSGTLTAFGFDIQHSTADNLLNARRGYQVALHAENAGNGLPGTFNYYSLSVDGRHYLPMGERLVIASRVQLGNIRPANDIPANVPFSKKYFLGGATSIRGWGRYEVSPLSGEGLPLGGNSMMAFSSELRAGLIGNLGGVLFLDGGNVWAPSWHIDLRDLLYAIGPGLRYQTPVGPIRFDFGYQLNREPGLQVEGEPETRRWRIHFSIGQAF